ncbi:MAG: single-stranded DNA-binding protein [Elusimicrobia bacterium]|jgi:single-stranded DNA-binding protein|nr:single-stranded DNA-binding protein [Elusimicrobiota bacterium]
MYSNFQIIGEVDKKSGFKKTCSGAYCITIWVKVENDFFSGETLVKKSYSMPVQIYGTYAQKFHRFLTQGMEVMVKGQLETFNWQGFNKKHKENNYCIVQLVASKINMWEHSPVRTSK